VGPNGECVDDHLVIGDYRTFECVGRLGGRHTKDHQRQCKRDAHQESQY
jgi:hypothetical protein